MSDLDVRRFLDRKGESLGMEIVAGEDGLERRIRSAEVSNAGLALAGFTERFVTDRINVMGETEISYLRSLDREEREAALRDFFASELPCVILTKAQEPPEPLVEVAEATGTAVLVSRLGTGEFFRRVKPFLEAEFAPQTAIHGSLADVYGVGLLFVGRSGIGKSECVLDLVERGHRLVADDVVLATRRGNDVVLGRGHELQQHHMEIRGIGIINVRALFGIRAVRQQKRIEVVVQLEEWGDEIAFDRTGLDADTVEILGVELPKVVIPLNPGKNITVIAEVVAMNHLLRYSGVETAQEFDQKLRRQLQPVREYLEEDLE